ncbi:2-oxoglutarate translocator [Mergibacter septicus]|uniref:2-oxoglutarate translocator n=1 Tax=Mergibacter septicus TaxID=221402 RepID=A0A8E3SBG7_9PAST|nr:anion permease [Mergibacter septicus]AWX14883.1 2-oxoglutarate translocator [Mergibacter septicus]QDJ14135.1 2-oxoglutarate translocator [Mergibacter septicus]UTU48416.1 DASS family sodium-coupled anion symporter [Mergibacter septicus]WMR95956.1 anion permease [Mergibacter septicus]
MKLAFKVPQLLGIVILTGLLYIQTPPAGLSIEGYHLALLFIATIASIVMNIMPTGAIAVLSIAVYCIFLPVEPTGKAAIAMALKGFNNSLLWLIVIAFMMARAFSKTGLGERISLILLSKFGQSSLRIAYCLGLADYILAPATPSNTARFAIISPIADSLAKTINSDDRKLGEYLISNASAMNDASAVGFSTAFAGNLALIGIAANLLGIKLTFGIWAKYLLLPSFCLFLLIPFILYLFISPNTKKTPEAPLFAKERLKEIGKIQSQEIMLAVIFIALVIMWILGSILNLNATGAAFIGLSAMLMFGILSWDDIKSEKGAWDTLIWFSVLMGMADHLRTLGVVQWLGSQVSTELSTLMHGASPLLFLFVLMFFFLLTSYLFASGTAKVVALGGVIIGTLLSLGVEPMIAVLSVAGVMNIGCNLTTYSHARNPLAMGYGYHTTGKWMVNGVVIVFSGFIIFMLTGLIWWNLLGF